jgi:hypothetical protein
MTYYVDLVFQPKLNNETNYLRVAEADSRSAGREISCNLWNPKGLFRTHKSLPLDPVLS